MDRFVALDFDRHKALRVRTDGWRAAPGGMVGITPLEFRSVVAHYPIFLRKDAETGWFEAGALLGFEPDENLFVDGDRWDAGYIPLNSRRGPFALAPSATNTGHNTILIDPSDPRVGEDSGEILYLEGGRPSDYLESVVTVFKDLVDGGAAGLAYTAKLAALDLIESVRVDVQFADRTSTNLHGLYAIKSEALDRLSGDHLAELRDSGFLEWIYLQRSSLDRVPGLIARRDRRSLARLQTSR